MRNLRKELGYNSIYVNPRFQSVKASLASLKDNHVLVLLGDQRPRQGWIDVTFFGRPAKAAAGPIALALSTGAPVVPMFMVRNQDIISHTLYIDDPLEMCITGSKKDDIKTNVQKYTDVIQSYVQRYPTQWMWGHQRWGK
jgi:KDO2-lipid IV(A) lauroyltransferase